VTQNDETDSRKRPAPPIGRRNIVVLSIVFFLWLLPAVASAFFPHAVRIAAHLPWLASFYLIGKFPAAALVLLYLILSAAAAFLICLLPRLFR
jgi:hypothetical protein